VKQSIQKLIQKG
jgi:ornithine decarboxylase